MSWMNWNRTTDSHLKTMISTNCCIHTVVPPDDGPRYVRNMYRLTKYTKNKLFIKFVFLYIIISTCTINKTYNFTQVSNIYLLYIIFYTKPYDDLCIRSKHLAYLLTYLLSYLLTSLLTYLLIYLHSMEQSPS